MLDCEDIIRREFQNGADNHKAQELLDLAEQIKQRAEAQARATGTLPDVTKFSRDWSQKEQLRILAKKRNTYLQVQRRLALLDFCVTKFKGMEGEGLCAAIGGSKFLRDGGRLSVDSIGHSLEGAYIGEVIYRVKKLGAAHYNIWKKRAMDRDIAIALWNIDHPDRYSGPKEAMDIAKVIHEVQEKARMNENRAGSWIGNLEGYIVRQSHDPAKIKAAGIDTWRKELESRLDWNKVMDGNLAQPGTQERAEFLDNVYKDIVTGKHLKYSQAGVNPLTQAKNVGSEAARVSHERVLYFKSGTDWFDYHQKFGRGTLNEAILNGLSHAARTTALMKVMGPSPKATLDWVYNALAERMRNAGDDAGIEKLDRAKWRADRLLTIADGTANVPELGMVASVGRFIRAIQSMSKLGGAVISSITDIPSVALEMKYQGQGGVLFNIGRTIAEMVKGRGSLEQQEILAQCGVFFDSMRGAIASRFMGDESPGKMVAMMNLFFKANLLTWWTDCVRKSACLMTSHGLARAKGNAWNQLRGEQRRLFSQYGIDADKWEIIRRGASMAADGREYLTPESIRTISDQDIRSHLQAIRKSRISGGHVAQFRDELETSLRTLIRDRTQYAVLEPDTNNRFITTLGLRPGTPEGEAIRYVMQFKSFPSLFIQRPLAREIYGRGAETLGQGLRGQFTKSAEGDRGSLAQMFLVMTAFGYAAMTIKQLIAGKTPREMSWKTFIAAASQGGALGLYSDFLFGEMSRTGNSFLTNLLGPTAGTAGNVFTLYKRILDGDMDCGPEAFRLFFNHTPGNNLFWMRAGLDYMIINNLYEHWRPGYLRRTRRRIEKENGQTFYREPAFKW